MNAASGTELDGKRHAGAIRDDVQSRAQATTATAERMIRRLVLGQIFCCPSGSLVRPCVSAAGSEVAVQVLAARGSRAVHTRGERRV